MMLRSALSGSGLSRRRRVFYAAWAICLLLSGCSLLEIKEQTEVLDGAAQIRGKVTSISKQKGPLNVLVFELKDSLPEFAGAAYATESGEYQFYVTPGVYKVAAHVDVNRDGIYQEGEHLKYFTDAAYVTVAAGEIIDMPALQISAEDSLKLQVDTSHARSKFYENTGKVVTLDNPMFSADNYAMGMWRPMDFLGSVGGGLFLLQAYDPHKTPILFVHGINGGPTDWKTVIEQLDTSRYQPWVHYYPSGVQLDIVSDTLLQATMELHKRYQFKQLIVAAHSMGGLVTRSFVKKFSENYPAQESLLALVMTVNSPMGGMESAASGVKISPIVVQSWKDVAAGSEFLNRLHTWDWPQGIPYHLFFSFQDSSDGDGVVALKSQLPWHLQREATRMFGFTDSHVGTLSNADFIKVFNQLIATVADSD